MAFVEHDHRDRFGQHLSRKLQLSRHETACLCAQLCRTLHGRFHPPQSTVGQTPSRSRFALRLPCDVGQWLHQFEQLHLLRRLQTLQQLHLFARCALSNQRSVGCACQCGLVVETTRHQRTLCHRFAGRFLLGGGQSPLRK